MESKSESKAVARRVNNTSVGLSTINTQQDFDRFVDYIADSKTYSDKFMVNSEVDGKPVRIVDRNAIATCIMLGSEFGFKPFQSIMLGRRLNDDAVVKVYRGRDLGLSAMASLYNIYVWKNETGGELTYTGIHVIYKILQDNNVDVKIIDDGTKMFYLYFRHDNGEQIDYDENRHIVMNANLPVAEIETALKAKRLPVIRKGTYRGLVSLTRGTQNIAIPYTLLQAVDARLYRGINSFGEEIKGKSNWNNHPAAHLIKMSVMHGARILIGDKLLGSIYIPEELPIDVDEKTIEEGEAHMVNS